MGKNIYDLWRGVFGGKNNVGVVFFWKLGIFGELEGLKIERDINRMIIVFIFYIWMFLRVNWGVVVILVRIMSVKRVCVR